jgi:integrase
MPGSVWERKDGRFGAEFSYETSAGKRTATTTKPTREAAESWLEKMRSDAAVGELSAPGSRTFGQYLEEWLRDAVEPSVSRRTHEKRVWAVRLHIAPALGAARLPDVDARKIQALYASMAREGYAHETRLAVHVTLKMALKQAVRWGLIGRNPAKMVDAPRDLGRNDDEVRHLTDVQARTLFRTTTDSRWGNYYIVAVRTGLRPGEMLALRWGDADLEGDPGSVRVRRTLDTHSVAVFGPPKTPAARRTVALHFEARDALLSQKAMLQGEGLPTGEKALVFPSVSGTPMSSDNLRKRHLAPALERAGLPYVTLHELRHTFASIMLHEWMAPPAVVSKMMGHKSIAFTFDLYGHLIPSAQQDVMRRLNAEQRRANTG